MSGTRSNAFDVLGARGFVYQCTDEGGLKDLLGREKVTCYIGFDPTADSLHVGSLVPLIALRHMKRAGHPVILLTGSGTAMVGDPSGKQKMRPMMTLDEIERNAGDISAQLALVVDRDIDGCGPTIRLDNREWLARLGYVEFLRDVGRYMSVNRMLGRESARRRFESDEGLSFLEFNYACLQAYDFLHLFRTFGCRLQMGGQDQWGNICEGIDLIARPETAGGKAYGLTFPLLLSQSGEKFGKTAEGAVWLDGKRTPPFDYYQFWRNTADADLERYLLLFTELPVESIRSEWKANVNRSKEILAYESTRMVHGPEVAAEVYRTALGQFRPADPEGRITLGSGIPSQITAGALAGAEDGSVPEVRVEAARLPVPVLDLLVVADLIKSKGEGRRLIKQGGISLDGSRIEDEKATVSGPGKDGRSVLLSIGKKKRRRIVFE